MSTPPDDDRRAVDGSAGEGAAADGTATADSDPPSVPADPETVAQEQVLDAFVDDDPRPTALLAERVGADEGSVERALRRLERQGVLERRERDARTTLWLPTRRGSVGPGTGGLR